MNRSMYPRYGSHPMDRIIDLYMRVFHCMITFMIKLYTYMTNRAVVMIYPSEQCAIIRYMSFNSSASNQQWSVYRNEKLYTIVRDHHSTMRATIPAMSQSSQWMN